MQSRCKGCQGGAPCTNEAGGVVNEAVLPSFTEVTLPLVGQISNIDEI